jgi:hypothetical protein
MYGGDSINFRELGAFGDRGRPRMIQSVKRVFDVRPEYLKSDFLNHIRAVGLPDTWAFITHETPPEDGIEVILQDFVISRHLITIHGRAPCPICSPSSPKYVKGHLLWCKRLADHARLEVPRHQSVDILRGPTVGHAN